VCPLDEASIAYILSRVLGGLIYLHEAGRLHRWVGVGGVGWALVVIGGVAGQAGCAVSESFVKTS